VDGDEVHYESTLHTIRTWVERMPGPQHIVAALPLDWYSDPAHVFWRTRSGRLFRTAATTMKVASPGEMHVPKAGGHFNLRNVWNVKPYAHWENYLKPWRRVAKQADIKPRAGPLPEVMERYPEIMQRFAREREAANGSA
jgi:hypothetical protein